MFIQGLVRISVCVVVRICGWVLGKEESQYCCWILCGPGFSVTSNLKSLGSCSKFKKQGPSFASAASGKFSSLTQFRNWSGLGSSEFGRVDICSNFFYETKFVKIAFIDGSYFYFHLGSHLFFQSTSSNLSSPRKQPHSLPRFIIFDNYFTYNFTSHMGTYYHKIIRNLWYMR